MYFDDFDMVDEIGDYEVWLCRRKKSTCWLEFWFDLTLCCERWTDIWRLDRPATPVAVVGHIQVFQAFFISLSSLSVGNSTVAYYSMVLDGLTPNREVLLYCQKKIAFRD